MAVTVGHEDVNGGNAGWTKKDVMDALETVFKNLQYHSDTGLGVGNSKTGVPNCVYGPGLNIGETTSKWKCGGIWSNNTSYAFPTTNITSYTGSGSDPRSLRYRHFQPKAKTGNTAYYMMEYWSVSYVDDTDNEIHLKGGYTGATNFGAGNDVLVDDKAVVWRPDGSGTDFGALVCGTTYYVIRVDANTIKLAATAGGAAISLTGTTLGSGSFGYPDAIIREPQDANVENRAIDCKLSDIIIFDFPAGDAADFKLWHGYKSDITNNVTPYAANKEIDAANVDRFQPDQDYPTSGPSTNPMHKCYTYSDGNYGPWPNRTTNMISWNLHKWAQTETVEPESFFTPDWMLSDTIQGSRQVTSGQSYSGTICSQQVINRYYCGHATHTDMVVEIIVRPCSSPETNASYYSTGQNPYWDYTVAGDGAGVTGGGGAGKDLTLRITRDRKYGKIYSINVVNMTEGWSHDASFTIPGEDIGGDATLNDITFGTNAAESASNLYDGTPSLAITNIGGDQGFFQKSDAGTYAILAKENASTSKKRSTSYYGFSFPSGTYQSYNTYPDSFLFVNTGCSYSIKNRPGIRYDSPTGTVTSDKGISSHRGFFTGDWTDIQYAYNYVYRDGQSPNNFCGVMIAGINGPTSNPLRIYYTRADSPQDTNFATITFVQYSNSVPEVYGTMVLPGGPNYMEPSPGVDLDELYHGTLTTIYNGSDRYGASKGSIAYITIRTDFPGNTWNQNAPNTQPLKSSTVSRNSLYGYLRDRYDSGTNSLYDYYNTTILRDAYSNREGPRFYHRDSTNDEVSGVTYYKPIKGIPLNSWLAPVPYYFPDDYALIQFAVSPGNTEFRYGDTITIGTSPNEEKYMVIVPAYNTNSRDWTKNSTPQYDLCKGVLFCARVAI